MDDLISRQAAIDGVINLWADKPFGNPALVEIKDLIEALPSAEPEPLTDTEQRIFLAAMSREKTVCKLVDEEGPREPYEKSLVETCHEIIRKVKGVLWT